MCGTRPFCVEFRDRDSYFNYTHKITGNGLGVQKCARGHVHLCIMKRVPFKGAAQTAVLIETEAFVDVASGVCCSLCKRCTKQTEGSQYEQLTV